MIPSGCCGVFCRSLVVASVAAMMHGCGGGGASGELGVNLNMDLPQGAVFVAGQSFVVKGDVAFRGSLPSAMSWSVTPLSGSSLAHAPSIANQGCANKASRPPYYPNGDSYSECVVTISLPYEMVSGRWRLTFSASGGSISGNKSVDFEVASADRSIQILTPDIVTGASAMTPASVTAALALDPLRYTYKDIRYAWSFSQSSPQSAPLIGAETQTVRFVPQQEGQYILDLKVTGLVDGRNVQSKKSIMVVVDPADTDALDVTPTQFVAPGDAVTLTGNIVGALPNHRYEWLWTQMSGPQTVSLTGSNTPKAGFFAPAANGVYTFNAEVTRTSLTSGSVKKRTAQTQVFVGDNILNVDIQADPADPIPGSPVSVTASVPGISSKGLVVKQWSWSMLAPSGATISYSSANNAVFTPNAEGVYVVEVSVTLQDSRGGEFVVKQTKAITVTAPMY